MSKEFYNYLAKRTINFFNSVNIKTGDKFILKLDNIDEVEAFYQAMDTMLDDTGAKISYTQTDDEVYETASFKTGSDKSVQLAIIPEINITNAYLTRLRNTVSDGCAIFIVCYNPIDSIAGGTESLQKEGMPFHKDSLIEAIETEIRDSSMLEGEKQVLYFDLKTKQNADIMDMYSLSDYADVLSILYKGCLEDDDFRNFGLFLDKELNTISLNDEPAIKERIDKNGEYFKKIDNSLKYGNIDDDLENYISEALIEKIKKAPEPDKWDKGITFDDVMSAAKKAQKRQESLKLTSTEVIVDGNILRENLDFFVRSDKETTAGLRKRHILIFNSTCAEKIEILVGVSDFLGANTITVDDKKEEISAKMIGKKVAIDVPHEKISINGIVVKCTDRTEKFEIKYCVLNCSKIWFDEITSCYLIKTKNNKQGPKSLIINCDTDEIIFNRHGEATDKIHLEPNIELTCNANEQCVLNIDDSSFNDDNTANVEVNIGNVLLPVVFKATSAANLPITGIKIEQHKLCAKQSFVYRGNNKLVLGTAEFNTKEELRENLNIEEYIVNTSCYSCIISDSKIISNDLVLSENVAKAYNEFLYYFRSNDTLPSLAYYDNALSELAQKYLRAVIEEFDTIDDGYPLKKANRELLRLGTIEFPMTDQIVFSSVHPINVAYQLKLASENNGIEIREDILKKLAVDNLIPFIHDDKGRLLKVHEQMHTPHWTYYCMAERKKYKGSRKFVAGLVNEKIRDFCEHFKYLFDGVGGNKIIINAVNMGDCRSLFEGIVNYYKSEIKKNPSEAVSIVVNVYDDTKTYNTFEVLSRKATLKKLLNEMGIKEESKDYSESEFINLFMSKVKYYRKNKNAARYDYCHLAFIEMDHETKEGRSNKNEIRSGTMLNGLISGVTSMYYGDNNAYRTGYGCKFNLENTSDEYLLPLTNYYNSLMLAYGTDDPYDKDDAICTSIDEKETEMINKTYDASNWVVFIDPKVDLNFFKNDQKDVMIIHYSDQHTTSSGYDAITVTRKTEQYENILKEYLNKNNLPSGDRNQIRKMIDMFNAVNGDWMLKLISSKSNFSKEKISIQSAIKLALAFFKNPDIIWIPISLEEILRVSGAVGLAKDGGLFSAKNLGYTNGATSDDLLLFGVEVNEGKVLVHLYPLEVKIGYKDANELDKATAQIKHTRKILDEQLINPTGSNILQIKVYRNFIAQLAVISADKLNLYKVWEHQDWERIVNSDVRGKLLNDEFEFTNSLDNDIGDGVIISFKLGAYMRDVNKENHITAIKFLHSDGIDYIAKSVDEIYSDIMNMSTVKRYTYQNQIGLMSDGELIENSHREEVDDNVELSSIESLFLIDEDTEEITSEGCDDEIIENSIDTIENVNEASAEEHIMKSSDGMKILFGHDANNGKPLYWYPNDTEKVMHPNTGIIGTMGTGKTQFTKSLILQLVREQQNNPGNVPLGILIFDYKGDYNKSKKDFLEATNAKVYELYHLPFNPFSITVNENSRPMLPMHIANTFKDTLSKTFGLGVKQATALRDCIMHAYELKGIDKNDKSTWDRTPPVLDTVFKIYMDSEAFKEDSLYSALSELQEFEIFEPDAEKTMPLYDLINGVTVIDLSGYNPSTQNLIVAITLDLFYSQMQVNGHSIIDGKLRQLTKFILVDEADNFLKVGFPSLRKILKEGREFGVGTILSTQFLKHFDTQDDDFAKYIYTWIVHNVADLSMRDVKNLFNTNSKSEEEELFGEIKKLMKHHSFVKFGDSSSPTYIRDKAFWELIKR